jgi:polyhydroxybutyrate depolymerase
MHGYGSNAFQQELYSNMNPVADTAQFILVFPEGIALDGTNQSWNSGFGTAVDDIGFIGRLIDTLSSKYNINPRQIYATGMSNGGFMSYTLACELSNRIAAVASVTGSMTFFQKNNCTPIRAVPTMQIHGTADPTVPYIGNTNFESIENVVAFWVSKNNCTVTPVMTPVPNISTTDLCTAERYYYGNGTNNSEVIFYKVIGGAHTWPDAPFDIAITNHDFNASIEIWRFFKRHPLPSSIGVNNSEEILSQIAIMPNPSSDKIEVQTTEAVNLRISNLLGQTVYTSLTPATSQTISVNTWEKGIYFVEIQSSDQKRITRKIIIE